MPSELPEFCVLSATTLVVAHRFPGTRLLGLISGPASDRYPYNVSPSCLAILEVSKVCLEKTIFQGLVRIVYVKF